MADLSNSSFIPKRGPDKKRKASSTRQVYIFTLISYVAIFATLLGAGASYFYTKYVEKQKDQAIEELNNEISSFSEADLNRVLEFDRRLSQANGRLNASISMPSVFEALEAATIDTVQLESLSLTRENDETLLLSASVQTDSFDSTIFQRGVLERNETVISSISVENLTDSLSTDQEATVGQQLPISFTAEIEIPISSVPYVVTEELEVTDVVVTEQATSSDETTDTDSEGTNNDNETSL